MKIIFLIWSVVSMAYGWNVFLPVDDRVKITKESEFIHPLQNVVYLSSGCTGAFVGDRLILTAAHCVTEKIEGALAVVSPTIYTYRIGSNYRKKYYTDTIWAADYIQTGLRRDDWAIILIKGNRNGSYMGFESWVNLDQKLKLAGYHDDFDNHMGVTKGHCTVKKLDNDNEFFHHDCDSTRGSSGGPLFYCIREDEDDKNSKKRCYVYGLNVAEYRNGKDDSLKKIEYSDEHANIGVYPSKFDDLIGKLRKKYNAKD